MPKNAILFATFDAGASPDGGDRLVKCDTDGRLEIAATVTPAAAPNATVVSVPQNAASVLLRAANAARRLLVIYNDGTRDLFVKLGVTASAADFTVMLARGDSMFVDGGEYSGRVDGIWAGAGGGAARVTETTT